MKRSSQVMLTAVFLTAVSAATARAQDVEPKKEPDDVYRNENYRDRNDSMGRNDGHSGSHYHTTVYPHERRGHGLLHLFGGHHHSHSSSSPPMATTTHSPRTRGFGTTMYKSSSSAHS